LTVTTKKSRTKKVIRHDGAVARERKEDGPVAAEPYVVEFPPETVEVLDKIAAKLKLERPHVISKALGLLELWVEARFGGEDRIIVERPRSGEGKEYEIDVMEEHP
jgi:hypothetical protein